MSDNFKGGKVGKSGGKGYTSAARPSCAYGDTCTRNNPVHFANYAHPGDPDWKAEIESATVAASSKGKVDKGKGGKRKDDKSKSSQHSGDGKGKCAHSTAAKEDISSVTNDEARPRTRCRYGDKCYRTGKCEFSHPGDADWDAVNTPNGDITLHTEDGSYGDSYSLVGMTPSKPNQKSGRSMSPSEMRKQWEQIEQARASAPGLAVCPVSASNEHNTVSGGSDVQTKLPPEGCTLTAISGSAWKLDVKPRWLSSIPSPDLENLKNDLHHFASTFELTEAIVVDSDTSLRIEVSASSRTKLERAQSELCDRLLSHYRGKLDLCVQNEDRDLDLEDEEKEERRVDYEDGESKTFEEVHHLYIGQYSSAEVQEYWDSMSAASHLAPSRACVHAAARPVVDQIGEDSALAGPLRASGATEEFPGLNAWLHHLHITKHKEAVLAWIKESGACDIDEIIENLDDLTESVTMTPIEKKRVYRDAKTAAQQATSSSS